MTNVIAASAVAVIFLWCIFVLTMRFKHRRDEEGGLEWHEWAIAGPLLIVGYPLDVVVNVTVGTVLFLEPPKTLTVSGRIDRYLTESEYRNTWRRKLARPIGKLLNGKDPGHVG